MSYHISVPEFRSHFASFVGLGFASLLGLGVLGIIPGLNFLVAFVFLLMCWPPAFLIGAPHFGSEFEVLPLTPLGWSAVLTFWLAVGFIASLARSIHRHASVDR